MAWNSTLKALSFRGKILKGTQGTSERNKEPRNQRNMGQHGHKNSTSYDSNVPNVDLWRENSNSYSVKTNLARFARNVVK